MKNQLNEAIKTTTKKVDEIFLFSEMMNIFNNNSTRSCFVKSVHSHSGFIKYHSKITNDIKKLEIADLQILNYNKSKKELRLCFVQAKYKKSFYNTKFISFRGNAYQLELLRDRCDIIDAYNNGFPKNILNFTKYKTITSYGVFFTNRNNEVDFLFTLPEHLNASSNKVNTTISFRGYCICPNQNCTAGIQKNETISICSLDGFEKQVLIGNTGAPINHQLRPYISSLLNSIYKETGNDIAQEMMRYSDFRIDNSTPKVQYINTMLFIT